MYKSHRVPYPLSNKRSKVPFFIIHCDAWGPSTTLFYFGFKWFGRVLLLIAQEPHGFACEKS